MKKNTVPVVSKITKVQMLSASHSEIAQAAAALWNARGRPSCVDDLIWLEAERRLVNAPKQQYESGQKRRSAGVASSVINSDALMAELDDLYPENPGNASTAL